MHSTVVVFPSLLFHVIVGTAILQQRLFDHLDSEYSSNLNISQYVNPLDVFHLDIENSSLLSIPIHGHQYQFLLTKVSNIFGHDFYETNKDHLPPVQVFHTGIYSCIYTGHALQEPGVRIALSGCGAKKRGLIIMPDGSCVFIQPVLRKNLNTFSRSVRSSRDVLHILHKRSVYTKPTSSIHSGRASNGRPRHAGSKGEFLRGRFTIETALFVDSKIWQRFVSIYGQTQAETELLSFVVAAVNNVNALFQHPTITPKLYLQIKKYHVFKKTPPELVDHLHRKGEASLLLNAFCSLQRRLNPASDSDPRHWDHALLFTGHDIHDGPLTAVAGFAPVGGMCDPNKSCTINEGVDFGCIFVIAHEMGHSLGMIHDGDNGCDPQCCIMSPFVGDGKTSWSPCSVAEMNKFLRKPGINCLMDNDGDLFFKENRWPGQMYTVDQQCKLVHGRVWKHLLQSNQTLEDVCRMLWCSAGEGVIRNAHPALEGTYCGNMKWCLEGKCQAWKQGRPPKPVHGNWNHWLEYRHEPCSECRIGQQKRIRFAHRFCNNPAANNGGRECLGAEYRGSVCTEAECSGVKADDYATSVCIKWKANFPTVLSGVGLQHIKQSCKIWCHVRGSTYAHSVGNFPDGTPCEKDGYCVRGTCMKLLCLDKRVLVSNVHDCPRMSAMGKNVSPSKGVNQRSGKRSSHYSFKSVEMWTAWTVWGRCSYDHWKTRFRRCRISHKCPLPYEKQRKRC